MADLIGRLTQVSIGREETTYGTKSGQLVDIPVQSISINPTVEVNLNDQAFARIEDNSIGSKQGKRACELTLTGIVSGGFIGQFLMGAFGTLATQDDTPVANSDTHTFTVLESNAHPSYSIVYKEANGAKMVAGALLQSLKINIIAGEWATYEATFVGKFPVTTTETITPSIEEYFTSSMAVMKIATNVAGLGASTAIAVDSGSITFTKNLEQHFTWGSNELTRAVNKQLGIEGDFKLLYNDLTHFAAFDAHTIQSMSITLTTDNYVTGTTPYSLAITVGAFAIMTHDMPRDNDSLIEQSITWKAQWDTTSTYMGTAVLVNGDNGAVY